MSRETIEDGEGDRKSAEAKGPSIKALTNGARAEAFRFRCDIRSAINAT